MCHPNKSPGDSAAAPWLDDAKSIGGQITKTRAQEASGDWL